MNQQLDELNGSEGLKQPEGFSVLIASRKNCRGRGHFLDGMFVIIFHRNLRARQFLVVYLGMGP